MEGPWAWAHWRQRSPRKKTRWRKFTSRSSFRYGFWTAPRPAPGGAALAEEKGAREKVYEPFLIQIGFLDRTPRGRVATRLAYEHFGIAVPGRQTGLFRSEERRVG